MNSSWGIHCVCPAGRGSFSEINVDFLWWPKRSADVIAVVSTTTLSTFWDIYWDRIHLGQINNEMRWGKGVKNENLALFCIFLYLLSMRLRWILKSKWFLINTFSCPTSLEQRIFSIHLFVFCSWWVSFITIWCV